MFLPGEVLKACRPNRGPRRLHPVQTRPTCTPTNQPTRHHSPQAAVQCGLCKQQAPSLATLSSLLLLHSTVIPLPKPQHSSFKTTRKQDPSSRSQASIFSESPRYPAARTHTYILRTGRRTLHTLYSIHSLDSTASPCRVSQSLIFRSFSPFKSTHTVHGV